MTTENGTWDWQLAGDRLPTGALDRSKRYVTLHRLSVMDENEIEDSFVAEDVQSPGGPAPKRRYTPGTQTWRILDCGTTEIHNCSSKFVKGDPECWIDFSGAERRKIADAITKRSQLTEAQGE